MASAFLTEPTGNRSPGGSADVAMTLREFLLKVHQIVLSTTSGTYVLYDVVEMTNFLPDPCWSGRIPCSGLGYHTELQLFSGNLVFFFVVFPITLGDHIGLRRSVLFASAGLELCLSLCRVLLILFFRWGADYRRVFLGSSRRFNCDYRPEPVLV